MRTIIVGDVHGCSTELEALLDRVAFTTGDRLVFVGDLVARGPNPLGVLDVARRTGAIVVRGNHEQKLLDLRTAALEADVTSSGTTSPNLSTLGKIHKDLTRALRPVDWSLLGSSKTSYAFPEHGVVVVHAGIDPYVPLDRQTPDTLMRIRTVVDVRGGRRGERHVLWGARYEGPPHIVFGHNAAPGLQLHPWATGLDTGCVYGGRLTALVLAPDQKVPQSVALRRRLLVSEPARQVWFAPTQRADLSRAGGAS